MNQQHGTKEAIEVLAAFIGDPIESVDASPPSPPDPSKATTEPVDWNPDLNPTQKKIFDDPSENILGHGEKGCLTLSSIISTPTGAIRLGRLIPDKAQTGSFTKIGGFSVTTGTVEAVWVEKDKTANRVELANGAELTGSPTHKLWTCFLRPDGSFGFDWFSFENIRSEKKVGWRFWCPTEMPRCVTPLLNPPSLVLSSPLKKCTKCGADSARRGLCKRHAASAAYHGKIHSHPLRVDRLLQITPDIAYAIGALVGDGSLNVSDGRCVGFTNMDRECVERTRRGLKGIGCELTLANVKSISGAFCQYRVSPRRPIVQVLKQLGIDKLSYHKIIPDLIIESGKQCISSFLRGLFDKDGCVEKSGLISFCTTSRQLGIDIQSILMSVFGILCVRRPKKSASGCPTWTLSIMGRHAFRFGSEVGFEIKRKQERIIKPRFSKLCPDGFNGNLYGFPKPICAAMRAIALGSRNGKTSRENHNKNRHLHSFSSVPCRRKVDQFCELYGCSNKLADFLKSDHWLEVASVSDADPTQLADLHVVPSNSYFVGGVLSHNSGKSIAFGHKAVRHAYENNDALVLIITPMIRTGNEGIWYDLDTLILPAWREGIGLEYTESRLDPLTKDRHRWIRNRHGGWSKMLLMSIPHASQVEQRVKGPAPSFVYVDELTECDGRAYWKFVAAQLGRRRGIDGPMQYTASCNAKGPSHWVWQVFFFECIDPETKKRDPKFSVYHVPISENVHRLPPGYVQRLHSIFKNDPTEWKRLIEGEWIDQPTGDGIFKDYYVANVHLKGDLVKRTGLEPKRGFPIYIGYDIGQVWQGVTFLQCIPTATKSVWIIFDECDHLKERIIYKMLALEIIERMRFWRRRINYPFAFCHITDESALNQWRPGGDGGYDAWEFEKEFNKVLGEFGKIGADGNVEPAKLLGCPKGAGSVPARVRTIQSKLYQEELFVSAQCVNTVDCLNNLECDPNDATKPKRSKFLHKFDSFSYPIFKVEIGGDPRLLLPLAQQASVRILRVG